jgi:hypothetical protein
MNRPHGPQSATNAALLRAQAFMTPSPVPSISTELLVSAAGTRISCAPAGATVLDEPCVVDGNLITARLPYDLPRMVEQLVKQLVR